MARRRLEAQRDRIATIKDVARAARVSLGTVSNYLNGTAPVAEGTATKIKDAIDELGFQANFGARALRLRQTQSIGLVVPDIANPFFSEIARASEQALWESNFQTFLCNSDHDPEREVSYLSNLSSRRVDGILIIHGRDWETTLEAAKRVRVPIVFLDRAVSGWSSVETDNREGGRLAGRHLLSLGHKRVALMIGDRDVANVKDRIQGFMREMTSHGVSVEVSQAVSGPQSLQFGHRVLELMNQLPPPTAIFSTNDIIAIGAWRTLIEHGYRVPEDVSLLGFDGIEMSRIPVPALSTIVQDTAKLGSTAVELLLALIRGESGPAYVRVSPSLAPRGSTSAPPQVA